MRGGLEPSSSAVLTPSPASENSPISILCLATIAQLAVSDVDEEVRILDERQFVTILHGELGVSSDNVDVPMHGEYVDMYSSDSTHSVSCNSCGVDLDAAGQPHATVLHNADYVDIGAPQVQSSVYYTSSDAATITDAWDRVTTLVAKSVILEDALR
ncbi:unnamed protein product [Discula destructiva]